MYLVPVEIRKSDIDGNGVFAVTKILKGEIVWKFDESYDKVISKNDFDNLDTETKKELKRVAYLSPTTDRYVYPPENDAARFTNHSLNNNLSVQINQSISDEPYFVAKQDIVLGEELTNNYFDFDEAVKNTKLFN